ncbi:unnamed protein product [Parascedosporium putredinis]|uniref:Cytochrome P450 alkane hydroxylase n=1 Tax=Parascedosporium putredinis TaxID=1442378 RepID=A0A9P1H5B0_9PEZI|nr:unnamed protein product [Parascedosporium putredinis]CAI7997590.1 unnamed protein product [Parascedosporium putredinis]
MGLIEDLVGDLSAKSVGVFVAASCTIYVVLYWLPFGIDFLYRGIRDNRRDLNMENWQSQFARIGAYTAEANVAGHPVILTAEPDNVKAILSTQFADYGKGEDFHADFRDFLGDSIFATDGDLWHSSRQLVRPQFIKDRVSDLHCFEHHTQSLFRAIANGGPLNGGGQYVDLEAGDGRKVDVSDLFYRLALDVSTDFLFGYSVDTLLRHMAHPRRTFWPGLRTIDSFVNQYIDRALALAPEELASKTKSDKGYTFLHAAAGFTRDRKVLRDQIVALLLAGRDTTASTLSFALYELSRRPDVVAKLRREILATVGSRRCPTYRDLKNMPYLKAVVNETLRLYPVVPFNVRVALRDTTLPRGGGPDGKSPVAVLKNTSVAYSTLVMQRRPDIYPRLRLLCRPRPLQPRALGALAPPRPRQFALTEMAYVICRMFQKFERVEGFTRPGPTGEVRLKTDLTLKPGDPIVVAFWEAKSSGEEADGSLNEK